MTFVVGITGSIAVGKSTVTNYLLQHGYIVLDADKITHDAYIKGNECYYQVVKEFDCLDENNNIDRKKLGNIVFNDSAAKKKLENIVHPYVVKCLKQGIEKSKEKLIFLDIPLLYEAHLEYLCDKIIVVYVDKQLQIERLKERNKISFEQAEFLVGKQMSIEDKKNKADYVIDNRVYFEELFKNIESVLEVIKSENIFK